MVVVLKFPFVAINFLVAFDFIEHFALPHLQSDITDWISGMSTDSNSIFVHVIS